MANARTSTKSARRSNGRRKAAANDNARAFVIEHREEWHDHFDLRLECDGVLKSWAVPNGPPAGEANAPRIAVRMDDVPIIASEAHSVADGGDEMWDHGTWEPASDPALGLQNGRLAFQLRGGRISGEFSLIRLRDDTGRKQGKENWLLKAERS